MEESRFLGFSFFLSQKMSTFARKTRKTPLPSCKAPWPGAAAAAGLAAAAPLPAMAYTEQEREKQWLGAGETGDSIYC